MVDDNSHNSDDNDNHNDNHSDPDGGSSDYGGRNGDVVGDLPVDQVDRHRGADDDPDDGAVEPDGADADEPDGADAGWPTDAPAGDAELPADGGFRSDTVIAHDAGPQPRVPMSDADRAPLQFPAEQRFGPTPPAAGDAAAGPADDPWPAGWADQWADDEPDQPDPRLAADAEVAGAGAAGAVVANTAATNAGAASAAATGGQAQRTGPDRLGSIRKPLLTTLSDAPMEMRQIAGLTAGSVMPLDHGAFQFTESIEGATFSIRVSETDDVVVLPGTANAVVDDTNVTEPTPLGRDGVLNVGSACFMIRQPRRPLSPMIKAANLESMLTNPAPIRVPEFRPGEPIPQPVEVPGLDDAPLLRDHNGLPMMVSADEWAFLGRVRLARSAMAERHRQLHPDPEELKSRLTSLEPGLWDRSTEHPMFDRFSVAYANIPWEPRFDHPERIPESLHRSIFALGLLPWVPVTANLLFGPLGIVGRRIAAVACARHAMLSLACLSAPGDVEFSIVTSKSTVDTWSWTSALPRSFFPSDSDTYTVVVADGMEYFDSAGLDHEKVTRNEMGLIVLAPSADELPSYCGTIMEIDANGTCRVANHLGESVNGTPIGVTEAFAHDMATRIADVLEPL